MVAPDGIRARDWMAVGFLSLVLGVLLSVPSTLLGRIPGEDVAEHGVMAGAGSSFSASDLGVDDSTVAGSFSADSVSGSMSSNSPAAAVEASSGTKLEFVDLYDTSQGAAITVNGVSIGEAAVRWVEDALGQSAQGAAVRPEALRSAAVDYLTGLEVLRQEAASRGLSVGEDDVRRELADIRASFASEEDYSRYLHDRGVTEEALALGLESELLSARLMAQVVPEGDVRVSDLAVLERLQPERAAAIAASDDEGAAVERAAATELEKLDAAQVADARAYLRQQERTRLFLEWRDALEDAADIE